MNTPHYLPTSDMRVALIELRRPFTPAAVRFKVQAAKRSDPVHAKDYAMVVGYIDARLVIERLNLVVGGAWHDRLFTAGLCELTVLGVTRVDAGEAQGLAAVKALHSDSLKRAAVKFGVGVSVYAAPRVVLQPNSKQWLRPITTSKPSWALTQAGEQQCRRRYTEWLKKVGVKQFGEPLDHGDVEASQGDWETEGEPDREARDGFVDTQTVMALSREDVRKLQVVAAELPANTLRLLLLEAGVDSIDQLTQATLPSFREALEKQAEAQS